ncbi:MAG: DUF6249 domain-containing protein [Nannocystaceae bacterium]|nr:DUF6249 domain-containing protein [bacterium]
MLLPPLCAALAFGVLGAPVAHAQPHVAAAAAPALTTELFSLAGDSVTQLFCLDASLDGLSWGGLGWTESAGGPPHGGAPRGLPILGLGLLGLAAVVVLALGRMRLANEHKRLDVAQRLIEQGVEPPASLLANPVRNDLRKGIVLLFAGGGLLAAGLLTGDRGMAAGALVPEFIGAGYLVSYWLAARTPGGAS